MEMVRMEGLEPTRLAAPDPKSGAATNYATSAYSLPGFPEKGRKYTTNHSPHTLIIISLKEEVAHGLILEQSLLFIFTPCQTLMLNRNLLSTLLIFCSLGTIAQGFMGARSAGLAGSSATFGDEWSVLNNQAGMAFVPSTNAGVFYESRFVMKELGDKGFSLTQPIGAGALGLSYRSFGYSLFSDSRAGLAYAIRLDERLAIGVQANYHRVRIAEGYGTSQTVTVEGGLIYKMTKNLTLATHLFNPARASLAEYNDERIPSILKAGAAYRFSEKVQLIGELRKPSDRKPSISGGLEYNVVEDFSLRIGMGSNPGISSFGFGWQIKSLRIDAATSYHAILGFTPQVSIAFAPRGESSVKP